MAILLEGYWAHVRCDDTSHLPEDKSASKELHGRTRDDLVQQAALLGWRLGGGIVLCPIHAHVEQGSEARKRLRSIAQQRISMLASGTGPNDAVVQAFASRGALEALSCLPHEAEFYFDEGLDLPGGPGSTVLRPLDEDPMLGKLFMLNVDRRGDRIEPPGVSSKPWGSASGTLVLQNDEPQTGASEPLMRMWEGSFRKPLLEAVQRLGGVTAANALREWAFELHIEDPDLFGAVFATRDRTPWWNEANADASAVKMLFRRVSSLYAESVLAAMARQPSKRLRRLTTTTGLKGNRFSGATSP